jgi:hypothetical protein
MEENNNSISNNEENNSNKKLNLTYSQNFWQNFPKLNEHIKYRENELSNLIFFISKLSSIYKDFSNRLSELININFNFDKKYEIGKKLEILLNQTKTESENYKDLSEKLNNEIIENLEFSNNSIFSNNKNFINLRYYLSKKFEFYLDNVKLSKKSYYTNVGECVQNNLEFEVLRRNGIKDKKQANNFQERLKTSINQAKESRKIYNSNINQCNNFRKQFIAKHIEIYNKLESNEKTLIQLEIDSIKKYNSILKEHYENLQKNNLKTENNLNNFDCNNDINLFINENKALGNGPFEIKYSEYSNQNPIDLNEFQKDYQIKISKNEQIEEIKKFLNSHFNNSLINENKELKDIHEKCVQIWENKIKNDDKNLSSLFLQNNKFNFDKIHVFLNYFNNIRREGKYEIEENSYEIISKIMIDLLNFNYDDNKNDFDSNAKYIEMIAIIIILSQTYYKLDKPANKKIFLQKNIQNLNIFKNISFWNKLIKYYIHNDLQANNYNIDINEKNIKNLNKISNIKISTTIFILSSFDFDNNLVLKIIDDIVNSYNVNKEEILEQNNVNKKDIIKNKDQINSNLINYSIEETSKIDDENNEQNNEIIKKNEDLIQDFENIKTESKNSEKDPKNKKENKKFSINE